MTVGAVTALVEAPAPRTVPIRCWYFDDTLDLKRFRAANPHYRVVTQDPLMIELERDRLAVLTKFGSVVFWNFEASSAQRLRDEIYAFISDRSFDDRIEESLPAVVGAEADEVRPDEVRLRAATPDRVQIVSMAVAQSVALDHIENEVEKALESLLDHVEALRRSGRVTARVKEVHRRIGFAMSVKHAVITNLTLFDKPEQTWDSPDLERIYRGLYDETFDLYDRVEAVYRKLDYLAEVVKMLLDLIQTGRMLWLEAAIVALIVFEIAIYFVKG